MPLPPLERGQGGASRCALHPEGGNVGVSPLDYFLGLFAETPIPTEPSIYFTTVRDPDVFADEAGEAHILAQAIKRLSVLAMIDQHVIKRD